jgi:hypothetical protein
VPGRLLFIQIDGLSARRLRRAIERGEVPALASLARNRAVMDERTMAIPPSTPVFQSALLYGAEPVVHGYSWFDRRSGRVRRADNPEDLAEVERRLADACSSSPLLGAAEGTASYFITFLGGTKRALLSLATGMLPSGQWRIERLAGAIARAVLRAPIVLARGVADMARFVRAYHTTRFEWNFLAMRVLFATWFEEVAMVGAELDLREGAPMVYINFVAYDEAAHRRGPDHAVASGELRRIDARIGRLVRSARERGYQVVVASDHGQARSTPFVALVGRSPSTTVLRACAPDPRRLDETFDALADRLDESRVRASRVGKWPGFLGRVPSARAAAAARRAAKRLERRWGLPAGDVAVVTGGSVAHVYVGRDPQGSTIETIQARFPRLLPALIESPAVGLMVARRSAAGPLVFHGGKVVPLDHADGLAELEPFRTIGTRTLTGLLRHWLSVETSGDLVLFGAFARAGAVTFDPELGSHGGVHPDELNVFVLHPDDLPLPDGDVLHPAELGRALRGLVLV